MPVGASPDFPARLLVIDGGQDLAELTSMHPDVFTPLHVDCGRAGAAALHTGRYDIVLADLGSLSDLSEDSTRAVARLARLGGTALIIAVSSTGSVSDAVSALQAGAHDCLVRPVSFAELSDRIAVLRTRHDRRGALPPPSGTTISGPGRLIARSPQMKRLREQLARIANSPAPVFLTGESGTGKRLAAETLHALGPQATTPFVAIDCALSPHLGEAPAEDALMELAGEEGTRALMRAGGGTLYLNEIAALGPAAQARLMNLVDPGGSAGASPATDVKLRVVCSTARSPATLVGDNGLRADLFYRLNVLPLHLPPLRQRPEDIAPLSAHFLKSFARAASKPMQGFTAGARAFLEAHEWPGNVRQLENLMHRTVSMFEDVLVTPQMLAAADIEGIASGRQPLASFGDGEDILPMWQQEQRIIEAAVARFGGNVAKAAAALEISPSTIYRKRQAWEDRQTEEEPETRIAGAA